MPIINHEEAPLSPHNRIGVMNDTSHERSVDINSLFDIRLFPSLITEAGNEYSTLSSDAKYQFDLLIKQYNKLSSYPDQLELFSDSLKLVFNNKYDNKSVGKIITSCLLDMDDTPCASCQVPGASMQTYKSINAVVSYNGGDKYVYSEGKTKDLIFIYIEKQGERLPRTIINSLINKGYSSAVIIEKQTQGYSQTEQLQLGTLYDEDHPDWAPQILFTAAVLIFLLVLCIVAKRILLSR